MTIGESVAGMDVFVVSPTHTNDSLIEMLLMIAAARRYVHKPNGHLLSFETPFLPASL